MMVSDVRMGCTGCIVSSDCADVHHALSIGIIAIWRHAHATAMYSRDTHLYSRADGWLLAATRPSGRDSAAMAHLEHSTAVLFGGRTGSVDTVLPTDTFRGTNETWLFSQSSGQWMRHFARGEYPRGRRDHAMATLPGNATVVMFGGLDLAPQTRNPQAAELADTWLYSASGWTQFLPHSDTAPQPRRSHAMASLGEGTWIRLRQGCGTPRSYPVRAPAV